MNLFPQDQAMNAPRIANEPRHITAMQADGMAILMTSSELPSYSP